MKKIISATLSFILIISSGITGFAAEALGYATVSVENMTFSPEDGEDYPTGIILEPTRIKLRENDTVMSVILRVFDAKDIEFNKDAETGELTGGYLSSVAGLAETDGGENSGWMITVNDWFATVGAASMYPSDKDEIVVRYSTSWGADLKSLWDSSETELDALSVDGGTLSPEFSSDVFEYELTLNRNVEEIDISYEAKNKNFQVRTYKNAEISDSAIANESEYESELSGLSASKNNLTEKLGFYKNGKDIPVADGDTIVIGCGLPSWTSMNESDSGSIYSITIKNPIPSEFETKIDEKYRIYEEYNEENHSEKEFAKDMAPGIFALYDEFAALDSTEEIDTKHLQKFFLMLGNALDSAIEITPETVYQNSKIKFKWKNSHPIDELANLRLVKVPKKNDDYAFDKAEDLVSLDINLADKEMSSVIKVGDMSSKPSVGERIEFYLDLSFGSKIIYSQFMDKTVVKASNTDGGGGGGGNISAVPTPTPTPAPEITDPDTTEPTPAPSSPYVYFDVPQKELGQEIAFSDLENYAWAKDAIDALVKQGVLNGVSENEFAPDENVTREQFVKMLVLAFDFEIPTQVVPNFTDVDNSAWYAPYVYAASYAGIVQGESPTTFGIGKFITREDMATLLYRAIGSPFTTYEPPYLDFDTVSDYAKPAVALFSDEGSISGYMELDGTYFRPKNFATRAEAAKIMYNVR